MGTSRKSPTKIDLLVDHWYLLNHLQICHIFPCFQGNDKRVAVWWRRSVVFSLLFCFGFIEVYLASLIGHTNKVYLPECVHLSDKVKKMSIALLFSRFFHVGSGSGRGHVEMFALTSWKMVAKHLSWGARVRPGDLGSTDVISRCWEGWLLALAAVHNQSTYPDLPSWEMRANKQALNNRSNENPSSHVLGRFVHVIFSGVYTLGVEHFTALIHFQHCGGQKNVCHLG